MIASGVTDITTDKCHIEIKRMEMLERRCWVTNML